MNYIEAINIRRSRRSYLDTPLPDEKLEHLKRLVSRYNAEGNLSIQLVEDGAKAFGFGKDYGFFSGVRSLFALVGKSDDPNVREKIGHYGELLVLEATRLGLGTCWVGGTFDRSSDAWKVEEDEMLVGVIPFGNVAAENSLREKLIHKLIHRKTKSVKEFYSSDVDAPDWFLKGIRAVQSAPSAINRQPVRFEYKDGVTTAYVDSYNGFGLIDLGIAKLHFSIAAGGAFELGNHGEFKKS